MRQLYPLIATVVLSAAAPRAFAQVPVIETVQNAASNIALTSIVPQALITIKGRHLATSTATAQGFPLPTTLGVASVIFLGQAGGFSAPLLYASPTQIDAQAPYGMVGPPIVVTTAAGASLSRSLRHQRPSQLRLPRVHLDAGGQRGSNYYADPLPRAFPTVQRAGTGVGRRKYLEVRVGFPRADE
jgi:hypothetical protein